MSSRDTNRSTQELQPLLAGPNERPAERREATEHQTVVAALEVALAQRQALLAALPDLMFRLSRTGVHLEFHALGLDELLVHPQDFLGRRVADVLPADVAETFQRATDAALETGAMQLFEYELDFPTRGRQYYEARMVRSGDDEVLTIVRTITQRRLAERERRELEAQVRQSQKLESLGLLAGGIAHDFNNLLTGVLASTDLAMLTLPSDSPARQHLEVVSKAALKAAELTQQLLAYAGRREREVAAVSVSDVTAEIQKLLQHSISKKARMSAELAPDLPTIEADAAQLQQVVMNLVMNASDALGDGEGSITLRTGRCVLEHDESASVYLPNGLRSGDYVFIEVADSGCGIAPAEQAKIFDPFFTTKVAGRGLGLSAVLGIVRSHKAGLQLSSEPDRGTTFRVLWPVSRGDLPVPGPSREPSGTQKLGGTVLLVDDDELVRTIAIRMLHHLGFDVLVAVDGGQAVEVFHEHADTIDLVLLDLTMPRLDGMEVLRQIRALRGDAKVVLCSGYPVVPDVSEASRAADAFLPKPYSLPALTGVLHSLLPSGRTS